MSSPPERAPGYPALRRQASLSFALAAVAGATVSAMLAFGPWGIVRAVLLIGALVVTASPALPEHPWDRLGPANTVTLVRAVLVSALAGAWGAELPEGAWLPVGVAGSLAFGLDWVDGQIARRSGWASPFGARLDMELDALTVLVLCGLAWQLDRAGAWVLWAGAMRYLFVAAAWVWPWMNRALPPAERRRFVCGVQIASILACLLPLGLASHGIAAVGVVALTGSFGVDVAWLWARRRD